MRLVDTSPQRAASVVRTSYAHGVEATAVAISHEGGLGKGEKDGWIPIWMGLKREERLDTLFFFSDVLTYGSGFVKGNMEVLYECTL